MSGETHLQAVWSAKEIRCVCPVCKGHKEPNNHQLFTASTCSWRQVLALCTNSASSDRLDTPEQTQTFSLLHLVHYFVCRLSRLTMPCLRFGFFYFYSSPALSLPHSQSFLFFPLSVNLSSSGVESLTVNWGSSHRTRWKNTGRLKRRRRRMDWSVIS